MFDILILILLAVSFAGTVGYAKVCGRLVRPTGSAPEPGP